MSVLRVLNKFFPPHWPWDRIGHKTARRHPARLSLMILEDRLAPAVLTVNSLADGPISAASSGLTLREAVVLIDTGGTATDSSGNSVAAAKASQINTASPFGVNDIIQFAPNLFDAAQVQIVLEDGSLTLDQNAVISGPGPGQLAVSGNNQSTAFEIAPGSVVSISGLTIEAGAATGNSGGGIISDGTLTLTNVVVSGNAALQGVGGGILNGGTLTLIDSTVSANTALNDGGLESSGTLTLIDSTVSGNTALVANGGLANYGGTLALIDSTISGNTAMVVGGLGNYNGGTATLLNSSVTGNTAGIAAGGIYNTATLTLTDSTVSNNVQTNGEGIYNTGTLTQTGSTTSENSPVPGTGGGILNSGTMTLLNSRVAENAAFNDGGIDSSGKLTLTDSTVSGNTALGGNGGLANYGGTLTLVDSTVSGNTASAAGGLGNYDSGTATLLNSTVSGNSAGFAGGILNAASLTLTDSTVSNNTASQGNGGGIFSTATLTLVNSTASGNTALSDGDLDNSGALTLIDSAASDDAAVTGNGNTPSFVVGFDAGDHAGGSAGTIAGSLPSGANTVTLTRTDFTLTDNTAVPGNNGGVPNITPTRLADTALENELSASAGIFVAAGPTGNVISVDSLRIDQRRDEIDAPTFAGTIPHTKSGDSSASTGAASHCVANATSNTEDNGAEWCHFLDHQGSLDQERLSQARWMTDGLASFLLLPLLTTGSFLLEEQLAQLKGLLERNADESNHGHDLRRGRSGVPRRPWLGSWQ